jgi:hypothetical protein
MISMADYKCNSPTKVRIISRKPAKTSKIIWKSEELFVTLHVIYDA